MSRPGMGVLINMLRGNEDSVAAFKSCIGKTITDLRLVDVEDGALLFIFDDGTKMQLRDSGRSCCESRYMHTDDDLPYHVGGKLLTADVRDAGIIEDDWGVHEMQFLVIATTKGVFTVETHNVHNGYYGGFWLVAEIVNERS